jgi:hypothetical protein
MLVCKVEDGVDIDWLESLEERVIRGFIRTGIGERPKGVWALPFELDMFVFTGRNPLIDGNDLLLKQFFERAELFLQRRLKAR